MDGTSWPQPSQGHRRHLEVGGTRCCRDFWVGSCEAGDCETFCPGLGGPKGLGFRVEEYGLFGVYIIGVPLFGETTIASSNEVNPALGYHRMYPRGASFIQD